MADTRLTTGLFDNGAFAADAIRELEVRGFRPDEISVLMSDGVGERFKIEANSKLPEGVAVGAATGGALGAVVGGLTAVGTLATGGVGLLVAGPIVGFLAGLGAGSAAGGLVGGLIGAGMPEHEAKAFADAIGDDKILVAVSCTTDDRLATADTVLESFGADHVTHV